jgi:hypothetical protein
MTGFWCEHNRIDILDKDKLLAEGTIEKEEKVMLGVLVHNPPESLESEPSYAVQLSGN